MAVYQSKPQYQSVPLRPQSSSTNPNVQNYVPAPTYKYYPTPTNQGVLGASTSNVNRATPSPAPAPVVNYDPNAEARSAAEDEARRREEEVRRGIESSYGALESGYRNMESSLGAGQNDELNTNNQVYSTIQSGLEEQKATNLSKLDANRGMVNTRRAQSVKDLQQNLSNTMRASSMQFGAMGAGDSSATRVMLPYAYTKLAGVQEGAITNQANDQLFQIDQDQKDTELEFSRMWKETEVEKATQAQDIKTRYGDKIRAIQMEIANVPANRARDLAELSRGLLEEARARLSQIESEDRQRKENVRTWATSRLSELNNAKLQLAGNANFNPQDILWNELQVAGVQPGTTGTDMTYNPMVLAQKKREQYLG